MSQYDINANDELNDYLLNGGKKDFRISEIDIDKKTYKTNNSSGTFRKKGENANDWHPTIISNNFMIEKNYNQDDMSKAIMLPVSEFERFFPDFFNQMITKRLHSCISNEFDFDIPDLKNGIEPIREFLEKKAIKKSYLKTKTYYHICIEEIYELPVIGVEILKNPTRNGSTSKMVSFYENYDSLYNFQGKYDPNILYILTGINSFVPGIRYTFADIPNDVVEIKFTAHNKYNNNNIKITKPYDSSVNHNSIDIKTSQSQFSSQGYWSYDAIMKKKNNKRSHGSTTGYPVQGSSEYIVLKMDPSDNIKIKYITVMGRPYSAKQYPEFINGKNNEKYHTTKHFQNRVFIMDEKISNTDYVKRIEVHGKIQGGKWVFIGTYDCNIDRVTEKLINLEIPDNFDPTYLKIIPISYEGIPSMRFSMYGVPKEKDSKSNTLQNSDTIKYRLKYYEDMFYCLDGIEFYGSPDWYFADVIRKHEDYDNLRIDLNQYTKKYNNNIADDNYDDGGYSRNMLKEIDQYGSLFALDDVDNNNFV